MDRAAQMFPELTPAQIERIAQRRAAARRRARGGAVRRRASRTRASSWCCRARSRSCGRSATARSRSSCTARASSPARSTCSRRGAAWCARAPRRRRGHRRRSRRSAHARAAGLGAERDPDARLHPAAGGADGRRSTNDLVLLGSRHSGSTLHIREFLSRNGQPFTYQDVETDPERAGAARSLPHRRRRGAGDHLPGRPRPQEPVDRDRWPRRWA